MNETRIVRYYLHRSLKQRAESGQHNFINKLNSVLRKEGFDIRFCDDSLSEQIKSRTRSGYSVFLMQEPTTERGLTLRLNYFYPFWNIEKTGKRWDWPVAKTPFETAQVPAAEMKKFANQLRRRNFDTACENSSRDGFVYVPLQGRLLAQRPFQYCSPIEMIDALLAHERSRGIVVTFHPKEKYTSEEIQAVHRLERIHPRLTISDQTMVSLLTRCDYVATQNSAVALSGFFFRKPAVLFGRINFHHIAAKVHDLGPKEAIASVGDLMPDYDAYLWWFFQKMSINAGRPDVEDNISAELRRLGWI